MNKILAVFALIFTLLAFSIQNSFAATTALHLVMIHHPACGFCVAFMNQARPNFEAETEIKLLVVDMTEPIPEWLRQAHNSGKINLSTVRGTPTFILYDGEKEHGRIVGYSGYDWFYERLSVLLQQYNK